MSVAELPKLLEARPFTMIHFDAPWDTYRAMIQGQIESVMDRLTDVSFAHIDVDESPDLARLLHLNNVPACAYYKGNQLVAVVTGTRKHDIASNIV